MGADYRIWGWGTSEPTAWFTVAEIAPSALIAESRRILCKQRWGLSYRDAKIQIPEERGLGWVTWRLERGHQLLPRPLDFLGDCLLLDYIPVLRELRGYQELMVTARSDAPGHSLMVFSQSMFSHSGDRIMMAEKSLERLVTGLRAEGLMVSHPQPIRSRDLAPECPANQVTRVRLLNSRATGR